MSTAPTLPADTPHALPAGTRLGEYEVRSVIGAGGFGIVYHAFDHALERDVAIKEYMPGALAQRSSDTLQVSVLSQGHAETFELGLKSFVNEARLLARFDHPSLVKVHRFWQAHGTAYMAMPLYRGRTLKALRQSMSESPSEAWLRQLLEPLLGALDTLHAEGVYHRDIAPDNILVAEADGRPVLLDFGAARRVIGDKSQALTAILKPSYAPVEQYAEADGLRQGAWTDLYALGATLSYAITGRAPQPATARALGTDAQRLAAGAHADVSPGFLHIVDWMMAPRPEHRPQSVSALREVLDGRASAPPPPVPAAAAPSPIAWERTQIQGDERDANEATQQPPSPAAARRPARALALLAALAVVGSVAAWALRSKDEPAAPTVAAVAIPTTPASVPATGAAATQPTAEALPASAAPVSTPVAEPNAAVASTVAAAAVEPPAPRPQRAPRRSAPAADEPAMAPTTGTTPVVQGPPAAVPPAAPATATVRPREQCEGRHLLALHRCLKRVCENPAVANHLDCRRVRQVEARNPRPEGY